MKIRLWVSKGLPNEPHFVHQFDREGLRQESKMYDSLLRAEVMAGNHVVQGRGYACISTYPIQEQDIKQLDLSDEMLMALEFQSRFF